MVGSLVNSALKWMWKKAVMDLFEVLSQHLPGGNEGNYGNSHSAQSVSQPRSELGITQIQVKGITASTSMFGVLDVDGIII
jgi:hypothetical protein